ncbi:MAG: hypothetical protein IT381_00910 [Deltaproteobacteria bacterium]|nr:hypothetical protein [Deltaproteobacteria bacterium]
MLHTPRVPRYALLLFVGIGFGFLVGAASRAQMRANAAAAPKALKWKHKCERPFNFDELTRVIEAREEQGWEMITVSPVVMAAPGPSNNDTNAYLRYVACFKKVAGDE